MLSMYLFIKMKILVIYNETDGGVMVFVQKNSSGRMIFLQLSQRIILMTFIDLRLLLEWYHLVCGIMNILMGDLCVFGYKLDLY
uniref:Uncharacterized protein n=1 Tax=Rhizophora mucronata TaxID=61149 RepID=A0A2P2L2B1_RHIMU